MAFSSTSCVLSDEEVVSDAKEHKSDVTLLEYSDSEITFSERLKICCKPKCQPRKLKNKGAILVLVWNFLVITVFYYEENKSFTQETFCPTCFQLITVPMGVALFLMGWLADVYFGRYKVLRWSIVIMWISSLLLTTTFVIEKIVTFTNYYQLVFLASLGIGYGMFQANIIQFGIDQLTDASSNEIISFINWYAWSYFSSAVVINFTSKCAGPQYKFIVPLMLSVALTVLTITLLLCNKVLIKEPVTQNPFKLIHSVIKYARKYNYAKNRSAFTYCEDELPSRLDFGKSKYGGPFTIEQVEDVKTFLRALVPVLIVSSVFGMMDEVDIHTVILGKRAQDLLNYSLSKCIYTATFIDMHYIPCAVMIPLNEVVIYPLFQRCLPRILKSFQSKVVIGMILQVVRYIFMVLFVTLYRQKYMKTEEFTNNTLACIFHESNPSTTVYNFRFYAITDIISSVSFIMILTGVIEFLCAQIPYSMKGAIVGLFYGTLVVFFALNKGTTMIFKATSSVWSDGALFSCGFWYLQIKLMFIFIAFLMLLLLAILYKKRKREDVLPNEHYFAERYYSKRLQQIT